MGALSEWRLEVVVRMEEAIFFLYNFLGRVSSAGNLF